MLIWSYMKKNNNIKKVMPKWIYETSLLYHSSISLNYANSI